jgi:FkbM family methyltransferase
MVSYQGWRPAWRRFRFYLFNPKHIVWWLRNRFADKALLSTRIHLDIVWLAANDFVGRHTFLGEYFENAEQNFLKRFLHEGMTFLDIGAHHGLYALLAAKKVGTSGKVIAFEPSKRELLRLRQHLSINHCKNVEVETFALGRIEQEESLYLCTDANGSGLNSLRPPVTEDTTFSQTVKVKRLDSYLAEKKLDAANIDFIKIDVEGGELDILRSASQLLCARVRPLIMCEVEDLRTEPWGYKAIEIYKYLKDFGFSWFKAADDGTLIPLIKEEFKQGNLIAVPPEKMQALSALQQN